MCQRRRSPMSELFMRVMAAALLGVGLVAVLVGVFMPDIMRSLGLIIGGFGVIFAGLACMLAVDP